MKPTTNRPGEDRRRTKPSRLRVVTPLVLLIAAALSAVLGAGTARAAFNLGNLGTGGPAPGTKLNPNPGPAPQPTPFRPVNPAPPQAPGRLDFQDIGPHFVRYIVYLQPGSYDLFRDGPDGAVHLERWDPKQLTSFDYVDEGLTDGTSYCHRIVERTTHQSQKSCQVLPFEVVAFENLAMTTAESDDVLARFDWLRTDGLTANDVPPPLYYANVLVDDPSMADGLRRAGVHVQEKPLFPEELAAWTGSADLAIQDGVVLGQWHYAVIPADIYNELRVASLKAIAAGETPQISALVLRRIPDPAARAHSDRPYQLSYEHLGTLGFEFNAEPPASGECKTGIDGVGCQGEAILGWALRHVGNVFAELVNGVVDAVRRGFGEFQKLVFGQVRQRFTVRILNTDPDFGTAEEMASGWSGKILKLANHRIEVRQGFGAIVTRTDEAGHAVANLAKDVPFQVCFDLENRFAKVTGLFLARTVCSSRFPLSNQDVEVQIRHPYANVFLAITDAGGYFATVIHHSMGEITVQVGGISNALTAFNNHRAFTPCGSKFPSVVSSLAELIPIVDLVGIPADFMTAVDIVLPDAVTNSRGVAVHEYGHAALCDMIRKQAGHVGLATAWADATREATSQGPTDEAAYINEAFADFIASQVVGGTNYFSTLGTRQSVHLSYCDASKVSPGNCMEDNLADHSTFRGQVGRVATILHDAFDGRVDCDVRSEPNDGAQWDTTAVPFRPYRPAAGEACRASDADETVVVPGPKLPTVLARWADLAGTIDTLGESEFLGGLARVMVESGYTSSQVCALFALHDTACPIENDPVTTRSQIDQLLLRPGTGASQLVDNFPPVAQMVEHGREDPNLATVAFHGTETIRILGLAPLKLESAFGVRLGDGSFEAVDVLGKTLSGTWQARGGGRRAIVSLDPGAAISLRELIVAALAGGMGKNATSVEFLQEPRLRLSFHANGVVTLHLSARFALTVGGQVRHGRYQAVLQGGAV